MAEEERRNPVESVVSGIRSNLSGAGEPSSSAASSSAAVAGDETRAREDARKKKVSSSSSTSSAAGGSGDHICEKCGRTFAMGQSLGGHMRKHYDGPPINANKKRAREQPEETPAPTVDRRVRTAIASHFDAPLESHNPPALPSRSSQEEPERRSAGNGAPRLHNYIALLEKGPKNAAPQPEPERKDDDGDDDEFLSLRLGRRSSSGV